MPRLESLRGTAGPQTASTSSTTSSLNMAENFVNEMLDAHNKYRQLHGVPPLQLDQQLVNSAQSWADHLADNDALKHDDSCTKMRVGENVAYKECSSDLDISAADFVMQWYSEIKQYDFNGPENQIHCGHFTQIVWRSTEKVGFGRAASRRQTGVYAVARYLPAANYSNQFHANVPPPIDGKICLELNAIESSPSNKGQLNEIHDNTKPIIGAKSDSDIMLYSQTTTRVENGKRTVIIEEKYRAADGSTYTKQETRITQV